MKCVVCKGTKEESSHQRWFFTSERAPMSRITLLFKVYECTKLEVTAGAVCPTCYELIAHIDGLEYQVSTNHPPYRSTFSCLEIPSEFYLQVKEATKTLETRSNCCAPPDPDGDYFGSVGVPTELPEDFFDQQEPLKKQRGRARKKSCEECDDEDDGNPLLDLREETKKEYILGVSTEDGEEEFDEEIQLDNTPRRKRTKHYNMDAANLDFNVTMVKTQMKRDQLVHDKFTYNLTANQPLSGEVARWKCTKWSSGCRAKLVTTHDSSCVLIDTKREHSHPPLSGDKLLLIKFREEIRRIVSNHPDMKPAEILTSARMLLDTDVPLGLNVNSITRLIQRWRQQEQKQETGRRKQGGDAHVLDEDVVPAVPLSS